MPVDNSVFSIFNSINFALVVKAFLILFLIFYVIFSLILFRQIQLMGRALPTSVVPFLKFVGIIHVGLALALFLVTLGVF